MTQQFYQLRKFAMWNIEILLKKCYNANVVILEYEGEAMKHHLKAKLRVTSVNSFWIKNLVYQINTRLKNATKMKFIGRVQPKRDYCNYNRIGIS